MSLHRTARLLKVTERVPAIVTLAMHLDRMVAIQMAAYPESWTDDEKREMAEQHLFGVRS